MTVRRVGPLPADAVGAAAAFHARLAPLLETADDDAHLMLVLPPTDYTHTGWRLAAVQALARARAPARVNAVGSADDRAINAAAAFLANAPGVTGQYWTLDGVGAPVVVA